MRIPAEGLARYQVENNRTENKGAKAVSESAALGPGFPDALPRQRPARSSKPDVAPHQRDQRGQQDGAQSPPQQERRKDKRPVLIDTRVRRPLDLANGTVIDVKI